MNIPRRQLAIVYQLCVDAQTDRNKPAEYREDLITLEELISKELEKQRQL